MDKVYARWKKVLKIIQGDNGDNAKVDSFRGKKDLLTPFLIQQQALQADGNGTDDESISGILIVPNENDEDADAIW